MSFKSECTIYKPIPIFKTEWVEDKSSMYIYRLSVEFNDVFQTWAKNNLQGQCYITDYSAQHAVLEFELQEDQVLFDLTWK